jgi:hypothetical protein
MSVEKMVDGEDHGKISKAKLAIRAEIYRIPGPKPIYPNFQDSSDRRYPREGLPTRIAAVI